jgi:hypothetical protein
MLRHRTTLAIALLLTLGWAVGGRETPPDKPAPAEDRAAADERLLKDSGIPTDDAGLLAFLRDRSLDDDGRKQLEGLVRQLGHDDFETREQASRLLIARGSLASPFLREALKQNDSEIVRRARECLDAIERGPGPALPGAAVRTLARRQTPGSVEMLLRFVPFADDEQLEEDTLAALAKVALQGGKVHEAVKAAVADPVLPRRAAAGYVLGRAPGRETRGDAVRLLKDADARVRFRAAQGLLGGRDRQAVPALIALLTEAPPELAWRAEDLLIRLAGDKAPLASAGSGDDKDRAKWRADWTAWWEREGAGVNLAKVNEVPPFLHVLLVPEMHGHRVFEVDRSNKVLWEIKGLTQPREAQVLSGGRVLIADSGDNVVKEVDRTGKVLWSHPVPDPAYLQRLPDGNTFIGTHQRAFIVTPHGKEIFSYTPKEPNFFIHSMNRKRDGNLVMLSMAGKLVEVTPKGDEVTAVQVGDPGRNWCGVEGLPGRRYLCVNINNGEVIEIDAAGKVHWQTTVAGASYASRLPNGNTMICSFNQQKVVVVDRDGKTVWEQKVGSMPWRAHMR